MVHHRLALATWTLLSVSHDLKVDGEAMVFIAL